MLLATILGIAPPQGIEVVPPVNRAEWDRAKLFASSAAAHHQRHNAAFVRAVGVRDGSPTRQLRPGVERSV